MLLLPGSAYQHFKQDRKHHALLLWVSQDRLAAIKADARTHHQEEDEYQLYERALFRYACLHPWSYRVPTGLLVTWILLTIALLIHHA